jgi:hypothetical protein
MLKAFNPVAILLISFAFKLQEPNGRLLAIVMMISVGCALGEYRRGLKWHLECR